jgi:hypothetical protein
LARQDHHLAKPEVIDPRIAALDKGRSKHGSIHGISINQYTRITKADDEEEDYRKAF